jgi:hypothetical protein
MALLAAERRALAMSSNGCFVPSQQQSEKLTLKKVNLLSRNAKPGGREIVPTFPPVVTEETPESSFVTENAAESGEYADERPASTATSLASDINGF